MSRGVGEVIITNDIVCVFRIIAMCDCSRSAKVWYCMNLILMVCIRSRLSGCTMCEYCLTVDFKHFIYIVLYINHSAHHSHAQTCIYIYTCKITFMYLYLSAPALHPSRQRLPYSVPKQHTQICCELINIINLVY